MKNYTKTLVVAAMVVPGVMQAQHGFKVGGKAGLNMANIVDSDLPGNKSMMGFHAGPTLHYGFGNEGRAGIGLDVLYSQKGCKTTYYSVEAKTYALSYIDVPIYFRYRFGFGLYLEAGVDVGLLMSAKYDGNSEVDGSDDNGKPIKVKVRDKLKGTDVGFLLGLGYIHRSGIGIGYRYNLGLMNLNKASIFDLEGEDLGLRLNTVGQVSLMYYFNWSGGGSGHGKGHHRKVLRR